MRIVTRTETRIVTFLPYGLKFMFSEFGQFMRQGFEDMNDNGNLQNGA